MWPKISNCKDKWSLSQNKLAVFKKKLISNNFSKRVSPDWMNEWMNLRLLNYWASWNVPFYFLYKRRKETAQMTKPSYNSAFTLYLIHWKSPRWIDMVWYYLTDDIVNAMLISPSTVICDRRDRCSERTCIWIEREVCVCGCVCTRMY